MKIHDLEINKIQTLIDWNFINTGKLNKNQKRFLFRGVSDNSFELIPKISRKSSQVADLSTCKKRFENLRQYLKTFLPSYGLRFSSTEEEKLWIELFHAQHYGAPTPLLDFSRNPLVALFFAVQESPNIDGMIYAIENKERKAYAPFVTLIIDKNSKSPYSNGYYSVPFFIDPPHENERIRAQQSLFCFFPKRNLHKPLEKYEGLILTRFLVPRDKKEVLRNQLHKVGINHHTLFPDLNGLGSYLNWKILDRYKE